MTLVEKNSIHNTFDSSKVFYALTYACVSFFLFLLNGVLRPCQNFFTYIEAVTLEMMEETGMLREKYKTDRLPHGSGPSSIKPLR